MLSHMREEKTMAEGFPILWPWRREEKELFERLSCPRRIPWALIGAHENQAARNHMQTLRELAERGGLSACEAVAVLEGRNWRKMRDEDAVARLKELVAGFEARQSNATAL